MKRKETQGKVRRVFLLHREDSCTVYIYNGGGYTEYRSLEGICGVEQREVLAKKAQWAELLLEMAGSSTQFVSNMLILTLVL